MIEFKPFEKIPRHNPFEVTITEKINGTNGCIVIQNKELVAIQSRKKFITPKDDNYGFASWVIKNKEQLLSLEDGYHYGEWAGPGIQKNPHNLKNKKFFLFNTFRWNENNLNKPACCDVVPVMFNGLIKPDTISLMLEQLIKNSTPEVTPEGIVVYYHTFRKYTKHTIISPNGKWCKE